MGWNPAFNWTVCLALIGAMTLPAHAWPCCESDVEASTTCCACTSCDDDCRAASENVPSHDDQPTSKPCDGCAMPCCAKTPVCLARAITVFAPQNVALLNGPSHFAPPSAGVADVFHPPRA